MNIHYHFYSSINITINRTVNNNKPTRKLTITLVVLSYSSSFKMSSRESTSSGSLVDGEDLLPDFLHTKPNLHLRYSPTEVNNLNLKLPHMMLGLDNIKRVPRIQQKPESLTKKFFGRFRINKTKEDQETAIRMSASATTLCLEKIKTTLVLSFFELYAQVQIFELNVFRPQFEYFSREFYDEWFQNYLRTDLSHFKKLVDQCENILRSGKWVNFKTNGFERDGNVTHPYDWNYPYHPWPFFRLWNQQNYSGKWKTGNDCKLEHFEAENSCLKNVSVILMGDSRTRQLAHAISQFIKGESTYLDHKLETDHVFYDDNSTKVSYIWSKTFDRNSSMDFGFDELKKQVDRNKMKKLVLIGEQILHPIEILIRNKFFSTRNKSLIEEIYNDPNDWVVENCVEPLLFELEKVKFNNADVLVLGSSYRYVDKEFNPLYARLTRCFEQKRSQFLFAV